MLFRSIPMHFWLIAAYAIFYVAYALGAAASVEETLNTQLFGLPSYAGDSVPISFTAIFILLAFVAQWIEAIRATRVRDSAGNDLLSVIVAFAALGLFVGVPGFQTTAFFFIVVLGFGDLLLDRIIGQAVARRDFGVHT